MSKGMQQSYVSSYMKTVNEKNMSTYYIFQFFNFSFYQQQHIVCL